MIQRIWNCILFLSNLEIVFHQKHNGLETAINHRWQMVRDGQLNEWTVIALLLLLVAAPLTCYGHRDRQRERPGSQFESGFASKMDFRGEEEEDAKKRSLIGINCVLSSPRGSPSIHPSIDLIWYIPINSIQTLCNPSSDPFSTNMGITCAVEMFLGFLYLEKGSVMYGAY